VSEVGTAIKLGLEVASRVKRGLKRFWSWVSFMFVLAKMRARGDAEELLKSATRWSKARKKERKPVNVWTATFTIVLIVPAAFLVLPLGLGVIGIVFQGASSDTATLVSQEALTGLVLVAAALGTLMLWFVRSSAESKEKRMTKDIGKFFLFAALALSMFMLLSPILPDIRLNTDSYSNFLKYTAVIFLMAGGVSFAWATLLGLFYLWKL